MRSSFAALAHFVARQRWMLFLYLSGLIHLSFFTHLAITGLKAQEIEICNEPKIQIIAQVVPAPQGPNNPPPSQNTPEGDGGMSERPPMANTPNRGEGEFEKEMGPGGGKWKEQIERTEDGEKLSENFSEDIEGGKTDQRVPEEYRNRKRDYRNIIAKDIFPTLKNIEKPFREEIKEAPQELEKMLERNEVIENYRLWREGRAIPDKKRAKIVLNKKADGRLGSLSFDETARRKYFDETLNNPKEDQLDRFLKDYGSYDPNEGDLPRAIRDLYFENLQRVASNFKSDMTYLAIDYFHEALNKEEFLRKALDVVSKKKGTKYATEVLLAIENIYEIQGNALQLLFKVNQRIKGLKPEQKKNIRVQTLQKVVDRYLPLAEKKGIRTETDALQHYYLKRTEVLDYLLEHTPGGYRSKDATFAKARVYWSSVDALNPMSWGNAKRAVDLWRSIDHLTDNGDFVANETHGQMSEALAKFKDYRGVEARQIENALQMSMAKLMAKKTERENRILWSSKSKLAENKK